MYFRSTFGFIFYTCLCSLVLASLPTQAQSWSVQASGLLPEGYGVFDIAIVNEDVVWAVAFVQNAGGVSVPANHITKVLRTIDGGQSWQVHDVSAATGRISFDIEAFDDQNALITTQDNGNGQGQGVFKTADGGITWTETYNSLAGGVWIRFFDEQTGILINRQILATTFDGGQTWQELPGTQSPRFLSDEFTIIKSGHNSCQVLGDHIWFSTNKGRVFRSSDRGQNWEAASTGLGSDAVISSVAFRDTLNGVALASSNSGPSRYARTTDGGISWSEFTVTTNVYLDNLTYVPGTNGVLIGTADGFTPPVRNGSAYSLDFGETWTRISSNNAYGVIAFLNHQTGWTAAYRISSTNQPVLYKWQGDIFVATDDPPVVSDLQLFPNPFTNELNISGSEKIHSYRLLSISGKAVVTGSLQPTQRLIDFSQLPPGPYLLEMQLLNGQQIVRKVLKHQ